MKTFAEFMERMLIAFPDAEVAEENGELVIHTGLRELPDGTVGRILPEDAAPTTCGRHGGPWGEDSTCERCTDEDGNPRR